MYELIRKEYYLGRTRPIVDFIVQHKETKRIVYQGKKKEAVAFLNLYNSQSNHHKGN